MDRPIGLVGATSSIGIRPYEDGQPRHYRGVVESQPGLYFLGLVFQYSFSSDVLPNRGRDARYLADHIARRRKEAPVPVEALAAA